MTEFSMRKLRIGRLHLSIVHNPAISSHARHRLGGFIARSGPFVSSTLRIGSMYINADWA